jgi:hypothetical protein
MNKKICILLPLSFLIGIAVFGQETEKKKRTAETADSTIVLGKGRIVYQDKIYRLNAPFLTLAYGAGYGFESKAIEQNMSVSYHYFIKRVGLQIGYHSSSDTKIWWRSNQKLNDLYLGIGKRWENTRFDFSVFGGPSYAYGSFLVPITDTAGVVKEYPNRFKTLCYHTEVNLTYKIAYDIGIGLTLYASLNEKYSVAGAQINLYFSSAFVRNYN